MGPYTLLNKIGEGGMGEVWLGRRATTVGASKLVAVKMLSPRHSQLEQLREMFVQEARLSMALTHSNIVQVFDVVEDGDGCAMIMEWVDGLDLARLSALLRANGGRLSPVQIAFVIAKLLRALAYAHGVDHRGHKGSIIHRDVSPQNVMLSVDGEIKLMDFGIARLSSDETSGGHIRGKPRYMPPEQLKGQTREPTLDLFAVGAILHELLDGKKFRSGATDDGELYGMILEGRVPPLDAPGVPWELERLRRGLLEADPSERIQTAREALTLLSEWSEMRDVSFEIEALVREFVDAQTLISSSNIESGVSKVDEVTETGVDLGNTTGLTAAPASEDPSSISISLSVSVSEPDAPSPETQTGVPSARHPEPKPLLNQAREHSGPARESSQASATQLSPRRSPTPKRRGVEPWMIVLGLALAFVTIFSVVLSRMSHNDDDDHQAREERSPPVVGEGEWTDCVLSKDAKSCAQQCAELDLLCYENACPLDESCTGPDCPGATQWLAVQGDRFSDPDGAKLKPATCDAPIDEGPYYTRLRCCCGPR